VSLAADRPASRYVVGIDLGTTNSALAYVDTRAEDWRVSDFAVPQLVAAGVVEARQTLPSFHYQRASGEFAAGALRLPWSGKDDPEDAVGLFAREHGARVPGRLITSAKSWLCHPGVDRLAELLPWHGAADARRMSPVEASSRYLAHLRAAWNQRHPDEPLEAQDVVLTLPASFDEVARELTIKAAAAAGLPRVVLVEEPQAAFYAWIHTQGDRWEQAISPGQKILVCDIGGGTSDFTLIRATPAAGDKVQFQRVAVGEHLILGGDNLDLALAHDIERRLATGGQLEPRQWAVLVQQARHVKETLLADDAPERLVVSIPATGTRLIGGALQAEVTRDEVRQLLVEGFLPAVQLSDRPTARRSGFQEFGLPYAADAAITRYLAAFLSAHRDTSEKVADHNPARPDVVLFNGGFFASTLLKDRLLEVLGSWFGGSKGWRPLVLANDRLDLAVARGAAYYGMVRRGVGVRISAALARSYFIGVEAADGSTSAVCLMPAGVEEGQTVQLDERRFKLLVRQPVEFPLYVSSTLVSVAAGQLLDFDPEQLTPLPPIRTVLDIGKKSAGADAIDVSLRGRLTEIGTLELWCAQSDGPRTWRLEFDVRAATHTDMTGHTGRGERQGIVESQVVEDCRRLIAGTFGKTSSQSDKPEGLAKRLAEAAGMPRSDWPPSLLRALWESLVEHESGRRKSETHEARWLNLLGFGLRPGYGMALDDWRVAQTWRLLQGRLVHAGPMCRAEWWILWRRIAGGLPAGQQRALGEPLLGDLRAAQRSLAKGRGSELRLGSHEAAELWRFLGSLEWLAPQAKAELGTIALYLAAREKTAAVRSAAVWAVGRIGSRCPMYGPLNTVLAADVAAGWIERLMTMRQPAETMGLAIMQLARKTGDRYRDLGGGLRDEVLAWLKLHAAPSHFLELVREGGELAADEQGLVFGESLPRGLRLVP
jgi:molecular chaperone DnaK (HSP70)